MATPSIGVAPHQPDMPFPQYELGRPPHVTKHSFQQAGLPSGRGFI